MLFGKFSLLKMKNISKSNLAIWSHWPHSLNEIHSLSLSQINWIDHSSPFYLRLSSWLQLFLKKMANPGLFFIYFRLFKHEFTIFTTNKCEKCSFSIQYRDLNSRHLEHESPPITSRPRFPPRITLVCGVRTSGSWTQTHPPILLKLWYMGTRKTRIDL